MSRAFTARILRSRGITGMKLLSSRSCNTAARAAESRGVVRNYWVPGRVVDASAYARRRHPTALFE